MNIPRLLDELRQIAEDALPRTDNPYDQDRYRRLLAMADGYAGHTGELPTEADRPRLAAELGRVTPKVGGDAAIFDDDGRILLMLRSDDRRWCLPCGWLEPNEAPGEGAVRESWEETGLHVRVVQLVDVIYRRPDTGHGPYPAVAVVYLCEITGGSIELSHEGQDVRYWMIDEVPAWHELHKIYARAAYQAWLARQ